MAKRSYKWQRWSECLPDIEPDGCSEFVEVCHNGCYPQIACWNTNFKPHFWQTNSFEPLFSKKDLKIVKQDEVWWRYIEYPKYYPPLPITGKGEGESLLTPKIMKALFKKIICKYIGHDMWPVYDDNGDLLYIKCRRCGKIIHI